MSTGTAIQWTDNSWNPWWGCVKVAQGCKNCYAERDSARWYGRKLWGPNSERRIASEKVWNDPRRWNRAAERSGVRAKVFCLSMGDILEDHPALVEPRKRAVGVIESTPWLDWQLLTKRPENAEMFGWGDSWPGNVWFGASAATYNEIIGNAGLLAKVDGPVIRFLSIEPLIEAPGNLGGLIYDTDGGTGGEMLIHWVIVGGESGPGARPCELGWIRNVVGDCRDAGVAVFVKQLGASAGMIDKKGGDWSEWPEDLRVREFPFTESPK